MNDENYKQDTKLQAKSLKEVQINYLLDKFQEECAEAIQAVSKIRRFGAQNQHPDKTTTNLEDLVSELEDILACVGVLENLQYFDLRKSGDQIQQKAKQLLA